MRDVGEDLKRIKVYWRLCTTIDGLRRTSMKLDFFFPTFHSQVLSWSFFRLHHGRFYRSPVNPAHYRLEGRYISEDGKRMEEFPDDVANGTRRLTEEELLRSFCHVDYPSFIPLRNDLGKDYDYSFLLGYVSAKVIKTFRNECRGCERFVNNVYCSEEYVRFITSCNRGGFDDPGHIDGGEFYIDATTPELYKKRVGKVFSLGLVFDFLLPDNNEEINNRK